MEWLKPKLATREIVIKALPFPCDTHTYSPKMPNGTKKVYFSAFLYLCHTTSVCKKMNKFVTMLHCRDHYVINLPTYA